jgi:hypothetical protein
VAKTHDIMVVTYISALAVVKRLMKMDSKYLRVVKVWNWCIGKSVYLNTNENLPVIDTWDLP